MYIYNVTIKINEDVHDEWLYWMKHTHIPEMLATGKFLEAKMAQVMVEEKKGGITYSVQYTLQDKVHLEQYYNEDAERLRADGQARFKDQFVAFRTELQVVDKQIATFAPATELLFTYGTLQSDSVQHSVFNRVLSGQSDSLRGYQIATDQVAGRYPLIERTTDTNTEVQGTVYELSGEDLLLADSYEGNAYKRIKVKLHSGKDAWVYIRNS